MRLYIRARLETDSTPAYLEEQIRQLLESYSNDGPVFVSVYHEESGLGEMPSMEGLGK